MLRKVLWIVFISILAAFALALANEFAGQHGARLGAIPTMLIVTPFLILIGWVMHDRVNRAIPLDEQAIRLDAIAKDPAKSDAIRSEAARRLGELRAAEKSPHQH